MKTVIIQHEDSTPPGSTFVWLESKKIPYQVVRFVDLKTPPSSSEFDLLIICGGSMNVDQEARFPWLVQEKEFIRQAIKENKKIVGLCLGSQLLAEALGGSVQKHPHWEVGWQSVALSNQESLKVFQWHGYSFTLPPQAELLATNACCSDQAYTYGKNIVAFQFHPETTEQWTVECANDPDLPAATEYVQTREEILRDIKYQKSLQAWYFAQLDSLVGRSGGL